MLLWLGVAHAGLVVHAVEGRVVVSVDGEVVAATPLDLEDLEPGSYTLGFWDPYEGRKIVEQQVEVGGEGALVVDLAKRSAELTETAPAPPLDDEDDGVLVAQADEDEGAEEVVEGFGAIFVKATEGATIYLDGEAQPEAAPTMIREVPAGTHQITVLDGCDGAQDEVRVEPGTIARSELSLSVADGDVILTVSPDDADVRIDGNKPPRGGLELGCGEHAWEASADGYHEGVGTFFVQPFLETEVTIALEAMTWGSLVVDVVPYDAAIALDGDEVGEGPMTVDDLPAGSHQVTAAAEGYLPQSWDFEVEGDEVVTWTVRLEAGVAPPPPPPEPEPEPAPEPEPETVAEAEPLEPDPVEEAPAAREEDPAAAEPPREPERETGSGGRVVANVAVTSLTVGLGAGAAWYYAEAKSAWAFYDLQTNKQIAEQVYQEQVLPLRNKTYGLAGAAVAGAVASTVMWVTTDFSSDATVVGFTRRF